jgi:hypothetical protein
VVLLETEVYTFWVDLPAPSAPEAILTPVEQPEDSDMVSAVEVAGDEYSSRSTRLTVRVEAS